MNFSNTQIIVFALVLIAVGVIRRVLMRSFAPAAERDVRVLLEAGALLVDVRSHEEFGQDHFSGARSIPLPELSRRIGEVGGADDPILVYCNTGRRSGIALAHLRKQGYRNARNAGGLKRLRAVAGG